MRPKFWFFAWQGGYRQVSDLADKLNGRIIRRENSQYRHQPDDIVINWGSSATPGVLANVKVLNRFSQVGHGKRANWTTLKDAGIPVPEWTRSREKAQGWNCRVVARDRDHGMGGEGIKVYQKGEELGQHKFYVKYVKKEREFRFHVFKGRIIFIQEKLEKRGVENADKYIRSHGRGWCFAFKHLDANPIPARADGERISIDAVGSLGLDFGAVDTAWSDGMGYTVLEVNSAPGIENTSLQAYVDTIKEL